MVQEASGGHEGAWLDGAPGHDDVGKKKMAKIVATFECRRGQKETGEGTIRTMSYTRFEPKAGSNGSKRTQRRAPECHTIVDPNAVFSLAGLQKALKLRRNSLPREIKEGRLKAHKRCGRWWIIGQSVLSWLQGE
jgi:hypothetical protein